MSVVAAYIFVCALFWCRKVCGLQSTYLPAPEQHTHKYMTCCHDTHNGIFIILTRDFS